MSDIYELINTLCPDGVPHKILGEFCEIGTGSCNRQDATDNGKYPLFIRSKDILKIDKFEFDEEAIIIPGEGGIGDIFHYINGKYSLHQRTYRIHSLSNEIITKFLYYYFTNSFKKYIYQKAVSGTVISIRKPMIENFSIPLPPLPVQQEIVRILDTFSSLTAELTAELKLRRKQYAYYRDELLTFGSDVPRVKIKDYFNRLKGTPITATKMKEIEDDEGDIKIFAGGKTVINTYESKIPNANITNTPSIIVQSRGIIDFIYYDKPFTFKNEMWAYTHTNNITLKYLYYYLKNNVEYFINASNKMGAMPQISLSVTENFEIPLPPLDVQQQIVSVLDKFDAYCNDLTQGLPKEIELRKKQYEYYRDLLLSFKEKSC